MVIMPGIPPPAAVMSPQQQHLLRSQPTPSFVPEICSMMHAFGDCARPSAESSAVVEDVVREQMRDILIAATGVAARRCGSTTATTAAGAAAPADAPVVVSLEDLLFLMRRSPIKVQRLLRYLSIKDSSASLQSVVPGGGNGNTGGSGEQQHLPESGRRAKRCRDFLSLIDTNGLLVAASNEELPDETRMLRLRRLDRISRSLDERRYAEFTRARQVGFLGAKMRQQQKFLEWLMKDSASWMPPGGGIGSGDAGCKIDRSGLEVLSYLAYETVGQIVEMSLLVRNESDEKLSGSSDPVRHSQRAGAAAVNPHFPNVQLGHHLHRAASAGTAPGGGGGGGATGGRSPAVTATAAAAAAAVAAVTGNADPESPLRKRLRSGSSGIGTAPPQTGMFDWTQDVNSNYWYCNVVL